jgi:hypothetical protein
MAKLSDLCFSKGAIAETVVSTYDTNWRPNAAPMGVIIEDEDRIVINLFNSSITFNNIKANKCAVANVTSDIEIFYKTAFKEANPLGKLPQEWFEKAKSINAPRLRLANATIDMVLDNVVPIGAEKTKAFFKVQEIEAKRQYPQAYCRAFGLTVEAIIHATRIKALINDEKEQKHIIRLLEIIDECNRVINRVAPNSGYSEIMIDLTRRIDSWRNNK